MLISLIDEMIIDDLFSEFSKSFASVHRKV